MGAVLRQLLFKFFLCDFLHKDYALCTITVIARLPNGYNGSKGAILKRMGTAIFCYKSYFLTKGLILALDKDKLKI